MVFNISSEGTIFISAGIFQLYSGQDRFWLQIRNFVIDFAGAENYADWVVQLPFFPSVRITYFLGNLFSINGSFLT